MQVEEAKVEVAKLVLQAIAQSLFGIFCVFL